MEVWDGDYEKRWYIVEIGDGTRYLCWPNAGCMIPNLRLTDNDTDGVWIKGNIFLEPDGVTTIEETELHPLNFVK